ncbi:MAG: hypothetical protein H0V82_05955 [Candidatus Protochlamydia sp.]|nr:hypothetical protein [Candidatus Protochlamydia sp.]
MINSNHYNYSSGDSTPYIINDGLFGATIKKNNEYLFFRMELLTTENTEGWANFKNRSYRIANISTGGTLGALVRGAGTPDQLSYESAKQITGFTNEEYISFIEKASFLKNKTENQIVHQLSSNSVGCHAMHTYYEPKELNYIVYVSKNCDFSISNIKSERTLKNFIDSYQDILITMGSNFSDKKSLRNRGISRNPYWVFEQKYAGLAMMLHAFTGAIAEKFFPDKKELIVTPVGSMQCIIKKNLNPGDGYIKNNKKITDITDFQCTATDPELDNHNYIKITALTRIYNQTINQYHQIESSCGEKNEPSSTKII